MSTATLNDKRVLRGRVQIPRSGCWWADAETDSAEEITGAASLVIADQTFVGTIVSGGVWEGRGKYHIAGGAGAWGTEIAEKDYRNDGGLKERKVLLDAASACGETFDESTLDATQIGPGFTRFAGPAGGVLALLLPENWHVGLDGKTRKGLRVAVTYSGKATRVSRDDAAGRIELAAESLAGLVPGAIVDGMEAIDVEHVLTAKTLRTIVWGQAAGGGRAGLWRRLVEIVAPSWKYRGIYEYRIVTQTGTRLNLQPTRASLGLPSVRSVPVCAGLPGMTFTARPGACVYVAFVNADPARPVVVGFDDTMPLQIAWDAVTLAEIGETVLSLNLGGAPLKAVARDGDMAGPWPVVSTSVRVKAGT